MSWPYKLSSPPTISQQAQHIGSQLATWAEPKGGEVRIMANMRHLWVLRDPLPFGWKKGGVA